MQPSEGKYMNKSMVFGSIIIILLSMTLGCIENAKESGEEYTLSLTISVSQNSIGVNDTFDVTYTLVNNGTTKLRILFPWWFVPPDLLVIQDENSATINCKREYEPPPDPENDDLTVLKPGENVTRVIEISKDLYLFEENSQYYIRGQYRIDKYSTLSKPYWKGEIFSNEEEIYVE